MFIFHNYLFSLTQRLEETRGLDADTPDGKPGTEPTGANVRKSSRPKSEAVRR